MATPVRTPLDTTPEGLSFFIQREGEGLPEDHYLRELPLNSFEAEASTVWIDYIEEEGTGRLLARLSDDGHGMSEQTLRKHIKTIHESSKGLGEHHGLGARVATLARNPDGVTWASRHKGEENLIKVVRDNEGTFVLERWELESGGYADVVFPDEGLLDNVLGDGTTVVLHGDGIEDTWTNTNDIMSYFLHRWWLLPGPVKVWQEHPKGAYWRTAQGLSEYAEDNTAASGEIPGVIQDFGLITIKWFLLKEGVDNPMGVRKGQIGALLDNEMFRWSSKPNRMVQFGITSRAVQERLVAVVELPDPWRMNTGRNDIERPGGNNDIDWAKIGEVFVNDMPPEIEELLAATSTGRSIPRLMAARFGKRWEEMIKRLPKGKEIPDRPDGDKGMGTVKAKRKRRRGKVVNPGVTRPKVDPTGNKRKSKEKDEEILGKDKTESGHDFPEVKWCLAEDYPGTPGRFAIWVSAANEILCVEDHFLVMQTVDYYAGEYRHVPRNIVKERLKEEYQLELVAKILHANVFRDDPEFTDEAMGQLLSEESLTLSMMGMQAIDARVTSALKKVGQ